MNFETLTQTPQGVMKRLNDPSSLLGLEKLKSFQISTANRSWVAALLNVDAPMNFTKYRKFLFQISPFGTDSTGASLMFVPRRNGQTLTSLNRAYGYFGFGGSYSGNYSTGSGYQAITATSSHSNNTYARGFQVWVDNFGFDGSVSGGAGTPSSLSSFNQNWMSMFTQTLPFSDGSDGGYSVGDVPGFSLMWSGGNITLPKTGGNTATADAMVICDIFGWGAK